MIMGPIESYCTRCERTIEENAWQGVRHDLHCWSLRTALFNLWVRFTLPDDAWDGYCEE